MHAQCGHSGATCNQPALLSQNSHKGSHQVCELSNSIQGPEEVLALFLKAEPHSTGTKALPMVPLRSSARSLSSLGACMDKPQGACDKQLMYTSFQVSGACVGLTVPSCC